MPDKKSRESYCKTRFLKNPESKKICDEDKTFCGICCSDIFDQNVEKTKYHSCEKKCKKLVVPENLKTEAELIQDAERRKKLKA